MKNWEKFELHCVEYLNNKFNTHAIFEHQGASDSTKSDILVKLKSGNSFYIEAKETPAQCGQFVLIPNIETREFEYSELNKNPLNNFSRQIIEYMNKDFDGFREAGTKGKELNINNSQEIFTGWIKQMYTDKNVKLFITNNNSILKIEDFQDCFDITATYRIKRSGSGDVGKQKLQVVQNYINSNNYEINEFRMDNKKLFVRSVNELHNKRFIFQGDEYMFSKRGDEYEVRKLSNTYNANVIFSIKEKEFLPAISEQEFINYLK